MTITLRPEHERLIAQAMRTGAYQNPDDVVAHALDLLNSSDKFSLDEQSSVEEKIEGAFAQFERGEFFSAEESRADLEKQKAIWLFVP
jgi:Arc/MetJ-type ribon-helix-helix transcriptional regulator